jgi:hypothetical protein
MSSKPQVNMGMLVTGGILIGIGGLVGLTGVLVGGSAVVSGVRRWARDSEVPPRELARRKWAQARTAASAGADAWQSQAKDMALSGAH